MLRYRADLKTLAVLAFHFALTAAAWIWAPRGAAAAALVAVLCFSSWVCAVIAHNLVHTAMWTKRWMNQVTQVVVSLGYGFPISDYIPGHNLSHHRYTQHREDVMRTTKVRYRWNLLNLLLFMPAVTPAILRGNAEYRRLIGPRAARWRRQLWIETVVVWSVKLGLLALNWRLALLYVIVPNLFGNFGIVTINYLWHDGCDAEHPSNHSRNFVGPILNFLTLNNGFHGMHHMKPGLHWSLLRKAHFEQLSPGLHPNLELFSFPAYMFKTFVYPGRRLRYDGSPLQIVNEGADRSWVRESDGGELTDTLAASN